MPYSAGIDLNDTAAIDANGSVRRISDASGATLWRAPVATIRYHDNIPAVVEYCVNSPFSWCSPNVVPCGSLAGAGQTRSGFSVSSWMCTKSVVQQLRQGGFYVRLKIKTGYSLAGRQTIVSVPDSIPEIRGLSLASTGGKLQLRCGSRVSQLGSTVLETDKTYFIELRCASATHTAAVSVSTSGFEDLAAEIQLDACGVRDGQQMLFGIETVERTPTDPWGGSIDFGCSSSSIGSLRAV